MIRSREFPRLTADNHRPTSPATEEYNCIAWSAGDALRWWEPGSYWPVPGADYDREALEQAFAACGYRACADGGLEVGVEKVALYADGPLYTHAARQLPSGKWTSKLGRLEDIEHDSPDGVAGGIYGEVFRYMMRPVGAAATAP